MRRIYSKETPRTCTVFEHIKSQVPWEDAVKSVRNRFEHIALPEIRFDPEALDREIRTLYKSIHPVMWRSRPDGSTYGLSLSYNPEHPKEEWKQGSFGHSRYSEILPFDYYKAVEADTDNSVRGDYLDSYGFRNILPETSQFSGLASIINCFSAPLVRCSIRTLNGYLCVPNVSVDSGFHQDDSPFEVLRINLCVTNDGSFGLQYKDQPVIYPTAGDVCVINSDIDHRVVVSQQNNFQRTHLILGVVPWFDYDAASDSWAPNRWFGVKHPYDMVKEGLLFS